MHKAKEDMLVIAAQQGNEQAFTFLCKYYQQAVSRFAFKLCGDAPLVQDALQNAWLRLANNIHRLDDPRAFENWVYKTVRWCVFDLMRQQKRTHDAIDDAVSYDELDEPSTIDHNESDSLSHAIAQLPYIDQQVIHLFYLEEMRISSIATVLNIPQGTVKSRLNRARKTLATLIIKGD